MCQLITWAGLIRHPACRSALIVPFLTKPPALRLRHTLPHCVHCWKLIQSSILYFLCRSPCSSASQTTHCATIQFLTQSRAQSLLRHLSTLDRVNFLLLYFIYRALFLTKIYANEYVVVKNMALRISASTFLLERCFWKKISRSSLLSFRIGNKTVLIVYIERELYVVISYSRLL